jgi:hypothetical protein
MAFMTSTITDNKEYFLISEELDEIIYCKYNSINLPMGEYTIDDEEPLVGREEHRVWEESRRILKEYSIDSFTIVWQYGGQLEACGYLDCTGWYLGDTVSEVADQLLEYFYDQEDQYMDEEEKADKAWLEGLLDKQD